jgi:hypothetical protein
MIAFLLLLLRLLLLLLDDADPPDDDNAEGDSDLDDEVEATRNPKARIKSLLAANERLTKKLEKQAKQIKELQSQQNGDDSDDQRSELATMRLENAFYRAVLASGEKVDLEDAWLLMTSRGFIDTVEVGDDGTVQGMDKALEKCLSRYPFLLTDPSLADDEEDDDQPPRRTASPPRKKRDKESPYSRSELAKRLPALARHSR